MTDSGSQAVNRRVRRRRRIQLVNATIDCFAAVAGGRGEYANFRSPTQTGHCAVEAPAHSPSGLRGAADIPEALKASGNQCLLLPRSTRRYRPTEGIHQSTLNAEKPTLFGHESRCRRSCRHGRTHACELASAHGVQRVREEAQHLFRSVGPLGIGVRTPRTPARPNMAGPMHCPMLRNHAAAHVAANARVYARPLPGPWLSGLRR